MKNLKYLLLMHLIPLSSILGKYKLFQNSKWELCKALKNKQIILMNF